MTHELNPTRLLVSIMLLAVVWSNSFALDLEVFYPVGDPFEKPLPYPAMEPNGYTEFQAFGVESSSGVHLGTDLAGAAGGSIRSAMNGSVYSVRRLAGEDTSYWNGGWGVSIIIVHIINNVVYYEQHAHMLPRGPIMNLNVGDAVYAGQLLGYVGSTGHSTGPHDHAEWKLSVDSSSPFGPGYSSSNSLINTCRNILDFIENNQDPEIVGVGYYQNGWNHDGSSQAILEAWSRHGGKSVVGVKHNNNNGGVYVHDWHGVTIQDFYNQSANKHYAIIYNQTLGQAFLLKEGFRWYYMSATHGPSVLGAPISDEDLYIDVQGYFGFSGEQYIRQDFATGRSLIWNDYVGVRMEPTPMIVSMTLADGTGGYEDQPETVTLQQPQTTYQVYNSGYFTAQVFDELGGLMSDQPVLILSSNPNVITTIPETGYFYVQAAGTVEIWAEVESQRWVKSQEITITVDDPSETVINNPTVYKSPMTLTLFERLDNDKTVEYTSDYFVAEWLNETGQDYYHTDIRMFIYDENGNYFDSSPYLTEVEVTQAGETKRSVSVGFHFPEAGNYYVIPVVREGTSGNGTWQQIGNQSIPITVITQEDLKPELEIFDLGYPSQVGQGTVATIQVILRNNGDVDVASTYNLKVSTPAAPAQTIQVPAIAKGYPQNFFLDFVDLPLGTHTFDIFVDSANVIEEYNEADNTESITIYVVEEIQDPDIVAGGMVFPTNPIESNQVFDIGVVWGNLSSGYCPPTLASVTFYHGDTLAYQWDFTISELAPWEVGSGNVTVGPITPQSWPNVFSQSMNYLLMLDIDSDQQVVELDEDNNTTSSVVTILEPGFDIAVVSFEVEETELLSGESLKVQAVFENRGPGYSRGVSLLLATQESFLDYEFYVDSIAPGQARTVNFESFPLYNRTFEASVTALVEPGFGEINLSNNVSNTVVIQVKDPAFSDLTITDISVSKQLYQSTERPQVTVVVSNTGQTTVQNQPACKVRLGYDQGEIIEEVEIPVLDPGQSCTTNFVLDKLVEGSYSIVCQVDPVDVEVEENEANNVSSIVNFDVDGPEQNVLHTLSLPILSDTMITRDWNDNVGIYRDPTAETFSAYTRMTMSRAGRSLLDFDFELLPPGATIISAKMYLYMILETEYDTNVFYLNLLSGNYDESVVTWSIQRPGKKWDSVSNIYNGGGDWIGTGQVALTIPTRDFANAHTTYINDWAEWDCKDMVQGITDRQVEYHGFILRQQDITGYNNQQIVFASSDNSDSTLVPRLEIEYVIEGPECLSFTDGFESGLGNWQAGGTGKKPLTGVRNVLRSGKYPTQGDTVAFLGDSINGGTYAKTWIEKEFDLAGYSSGQITVDVCTYSLYSSEYAAVKIWDGQWHTVAQTKSASWQNVVIDLSQFSLMDGFKVRLESYMNYTEGSDAAYFDNFVIEAN